MYALDLSYYPKEIKKRNGEIVPFDESKIENAVLKAMQACGEGSPQQAQKVAKGVLKEIIKIKRHFRGFVPEVEGIQDLVEKTLIFERLVKTAKAYILYRDKRSSFRQQKEHIPEHIKKLADESKTYFKSDFNEFVYLRTYSRWVEDENRRETWVETVDRYMNFMRENIGNKLTEKEYKELREGILTQNVMPSMRLMQFSGTAARATNVCAYNCSYIAPVKLDDFADVMYVLMCGTGVGFSVENQNIQALPQIAMQTGRKHPTYVVEDSREGWCDAFKIGLKTWYAGEDIDFDFSQCRPAGARLKTLGGKSSGPRPLNDLLTFSRGKILSRQGGRLSTLDTHDILCKIGEIVVAGGVRRSAMISLSDLNDADLRNAKKGQFYYNDPQRIIANNSAAYVRKPSSREFLEEWLALVNSGSGERGIFNRGGLLHTLPERRLKHLRQKEDIVNGNIVGFIGTNPCGEIVLRSKQFCNLTEVIAKPEDTRESLLNKVRLAAILGTYQASLTHFPYLSEDWVKNCEEERLLGVSITGQWDSEAVRHADVFRDLKEESLKTNREYAKRFGINPATAVTCVKPSGNVSQVVDCASGMHPRFAKYYIRRVRVAATDALFQMMKAKGLPYHPEVGQTLENATTYILEFPIKAPENAVTRHDLSALQQLEYWKVVKTNYTEHNPSITVYVKDEEWVAVADWVYENWDLVGGLTFLPHTDHVYRLAPYEEIDEATYNDLMKKTPHLDFSELYLFETTDPTELKRELACSAGVCEIV
ncbi:MAG: ribonucleoside-triphosphate reductase [Deltaproteobacteria bacterium]|nr:ribonucleoside-triphosphate reductase [Deltaproteobacteria bacterium]